MKIQIISSTSENLVLFFEFVHLHALWVHQFDDKHLILQDRKGRREDDSEAYNEER